MTLEKAIYNMCGQYPSEEELAEIKELANETILPHPVIRDGKGKFIKDHTPRDFFLKLQEEVFEAMASSTFTDEFAEEVTDIITVCISYLNANGYDEEKRSELFAKVNEKNEKRGYFEEKNFIKGDI